MEETLALLPPPTLGICIRISLVAQLVKNPPAMQETQINPWVGKIHWRREKLPTPVLLPGKFHEQRSLVGYSPWDRKESDVTEQLHKITAVTAAMKLKDTYS